LAVLLQLDRSPEPMGFNGSVETVRRYLRTLRGDRTRRAKLTVRFETPPGKQAQADSAYCGKHGALGGPLVSVYAFVMVLSFSRMMFLRFTTSMKMAALIECHREAFAFFGGVTSEILYDNMKQVRAGANQLNEQLVDFARHYGYAIRTHRPYRPRTKGKVERPVEYIKDNFLAGREFGGIDELNARALHWLEHTANIRVHGTTKQRPIDLLEEERKAMTPLAGIAPYRFVDPVQRVVSFESMVRFQGSSYSVPPAHAGRPVMVAADAGHVIVTVDDAIVAEHRQAERPGQCIVERDHLAELWKITNERIALPADAPRWHIRFDEAVATTPLATYEEVAS
jgi:transposase